MNDYYRVEVKAEPCSEDILDLMAAALADVGFESFEPQEDSLVAWLSVTNWRQYNADKALEGPEEIAMNALRDDFPIPDVKFTLAGCEKVEGQDWNEEWEKNYFQPIVIGDRCVIHASFHKDVPEAEYDIVIDPRMAFGTGHHDTTSQMVEHILESDLEGKTVIDMGTGTGILAMLAKMRGAGTVTGIEIDEPAWENAVDNAKLNSLDVKMIHGDASALAGLEKGDFLFANINRNIILGDLDRYAAALKPGGTMLLSGFYEEDIPMIEEAAAKYGLTEVSRKVRNRWTALRLTGSLL